MILLKNIRLINWYAFSNITAPIGYFTLIAGKNGNGKSVLLDAIKYAAYGDTVFNKSSEVKGVRVRTVVSYTRGLLDATAGTYIRPADKVPNVYSHIALEYYDDVEEKSFILGAVIETTASNNYQVRRYALENATLDKIEHVYTEDGLTKPYSANALQKKYKLLLLDREPGLKKFMQLTGLKLNVPKQLPAYLRKLRGIMTYDPNAKIDAFIRDSVLTEHSVDFDKLIEAKNNIEKLNATFSGVEKEITELDKILGEYDTYNSERNRLLVDDIKRVYKEKLSLTARLEKLGRKKELAEQEKKELAEFLTVLDNRLQDVETRLYEANVSFAQLDGTRAIEEEKRHVADLRQRQQRLKQKCEQLSFFQTKVSEILHSLMQEGVEIGRKDVLASLGSREFSNAQKVEAVAELKQLVLAAYEKKVAELTALAAKIAKLNDELERQHQILQDCEHHIHAYSQIPDYVGLRDEINREFAKRQLNTQACFACEYVISIKDEKWRDALESFLGRRRYTILVEPQYYDIADDVLNNSRYRYAHLFNTKLLLKKKVEVEQDSVLKQLEIKNEIAKKYFAYQLGRMHAVPLNEVRNYENAITKEGRVSVALDSYFLRFDKLRFYYLGQKTFELNRKRAEKMIRELTGERKELLAEQKQLNERKEQLKMDQEAFRDYAYEAPVEYEQLLEQLQQAEKNLRELQKAQAKNEAFLELSALIAKLEQEKKFIKQELDSKRYRDSELNTLIMGAQQTLKNVAEELTTVEKKFHDYEVEEYTLLCKAVEAYDRFLAEGSKGVGDTVAEATRSRIEASIKQHFQLLVEAQGAYNNSHAEAALPVGVEGRDAYAARREAIWMDDLQEVRQQLAEQTQHYEDVFKNEFVLNIYKYCEAARSELREINTELAKLNFSAKYQFDVRYVKDGSDYERILAYAKYLDEQEQGGDAGGLNMFASAPAEDGLRLEQEMKLIINRIIAKNNEELIRRFADYRNYMTYEVLVSNSILDRAKLSRQTGFNSGAEVQIPYMLILLAALLLVYNQHINSTRLVFIDEPFAKMDPGNVKLMLDFMKAQQLQVIFCSPDKTETIGNACEVVLPVLRVQADNMQLGIVKFHEEQAYGRI